MPAYPDQVFEGKVQAIIPTLDPEKRTARLRVVLPNPASRLKPGMFATLRSLSAPTLRLSRFQSTASSSRAAPHSSS